MRGPSAFTARGRNNAVGAKRQEPQPD